MGTRTTNRRLRVRETPTETRFRWLRVAFFIIIGAALALETESSAPDPLASIGVFFHANVSSWLDCSIKDCSLKFSSVKVIFSVLEISLGVIFLLWFLVGRKSGRRIGPKYNLGTLIMPLALFGAMLLVGVLFGISRGGGDSTIALWEIRGFLMMIAVYFLAGIFITDENHINTLIWVVFIAAGILCTDNILRWFFLYRSDTMDDLAYDHVDSVVLVFAALLCMSLLLFGGTRAQRRYAAFLLPAIVFALDVMKRRAAFAILGVGVVVLVIIILRLRPRLFWTIVVPCLGLALVYLAIFWNDTSALGQPARAISSMFTPDPRDAASNLYRVLEHADILANIQTSPILGLGFGQQFIFYYALPDLSFWPFWHYTPHNAVLWVWLKDGALGFGAFFWLLSRAVYDGSVALEGQREQWQVVAAVRRALSRRRGKAAAQGKKRPADLPLGFGILRQRPRRGGRRRDVSDGAPEDDIAWNVPSWERSDSRKSQTAAPSGVIAMLTTTICLIPMQIAFSYVDLGLTSERDLLLFGLALGIVARAQAPLAGIARIRSQEARRGRQRQRPVMVRHAPDDEYAEPAGAVPSQPSDILD